MVEDLIIEAKEFFEYYKKEIGKSAKQGKKSVQISFKDITAFSPELADSLLQKPEEVIGVLELALEEMKIIKNARVRLIEMSQSQCLTIREIRSQHLNQIISIEGIVRQASDVRPQVVNAKFECPSCGTIISVLQIEKKFREPSRCSCGRKMGFKLISKDMVDAQRLVVEETPESLKGGEQPRRLNIFLKEDMVDPKMEERTTPGSKIRVIGVLKEVPVPLPTGSISTRFDLALEANNVIPMEETFEEVEISEEEERQIRELASDPELYKKLGSSMAPSIHGYDEIKLAIALQLIGGVRKKKSDGTFSRGDIHILLVGDPGVAKSVMLKFISAVAPKGRYVVGGATTQAGITATVVRDEYLRGWALEAGAIVLANRGIVCIDELGRMAEQDRSGLHEAMEQQTVTISKANVQAMLRAETSVLGAANPKFGRFDPWQPVAQQIDMSSTLINRFDLIFVMKDFPSREKDTAIATHVLREQKRESVKPPIDQEMLRKYISYVKQKIFPVLTEQAIDEIRNFYVELRNAPALSEDVLRPIPISARQLEALIRLSEASARARLSKKITKDDARRAIEIMHNYLLQVGIDKETGALDIDKIATGISTRERSKIVIVREALTKLESRTGKMIPVNELKTELADKVTEDEIDDAIEKLRISGDIFEPKRGFVQKTR